jgi:cell division protein FtsI/penicillin-binding protein 2
MTVAVSAIVNGGNILEPHVVNKVVNQSGDTVYAQDTKIIRNVGISAPTLKIIEDGLRLGVTAGTGGSLKNLPGYIITKTGSSDAGEWINGKYYTGAHSWIMGCFEYDGETYCFTVMQQWGGRGYRTVPIMKKFINCVYNNFSDGCENIN